MPDVPLEISRKYKCLLRNEFVRGNYKLVPIRDADKFVIMKWRNEQIDILRQNEPLTEEKQQQYFKDTVDELFLQDNPSQLLFSFLEEGILIGYGGLVHIDWKNRKAEVSFLTATERNLDETGFSEDWSAYLSIIKTISDVHLGFSKIFTYAYDLRPQLYPILLRNNFVEEERIKDYVLVNGHLRDVLIHSVSFEVISFRMAVKEDALLYFKWANDETVRDNSFNNAPIIYEEHCKWFFSKLSSGKCFFFLFFNKRGLPVGQVRIDASGEETVIGASVDESFRGKSLSSKMLVGAIRDYLRKYRERPIIAYIKCDNIASYKAFLTAGFIEQAIVSMGETKCYKLSIRA